MGKYDYPEERPRKPLFLFEDSRSFWIPIVNANSDIRVKGHVYFCKGKQAAKALTSDKMYVTLIPCQHSYLVRTYMKGRLGLTYIL